MNYDAGRRESDAAPTCWISKANANSHMQPRAVCLSTTRHHHHHYQPHNIILGNQHIVFAYCSFFTNWVRDMCQYSCAHKLVVILRNFTFIVGFIYHTLYVGFEKNIRQQIKFSLYKFYNFMYLSLSLGKSTISVSQIILLFILWYLCWTEMSGFW